MDDEERGGVRRWAARIGSVLGALPLLYPLSLGPVAWWAERYNPSFQFAVAVERFYWPVITLADQYELLDNVLRWYMDLWI